MGQLDQNAQVSASLSRCPVRGHHRRAGRPGLERRLWKPISRITHYCRAAQDGGNPSTCVPKLRRLKREFTKILTLVISVDDVAAPDVNIHRPVPVIRNAKSFRIRRFKRRRSDDWPARVPRLLRFHAPGRPHLQRSSEKLALSPVLESRPASPRFTAWRLRSGCSGRTVWPR